MILNRNSAKSAAICLAIAFATQGPAIAFDAEREDSLYGRINRYGSGTSLIPRAAHLRSYHLEAVDTLFMAHGDVTLGVANQSGPRGGQAITLENWEMLMATRKLGPGFVDLRFKSSLEPFAMPPGGMPQLLQTGETYLRKPIVDKQHPHDLLMELAGRYSLQPVPWGEVFVYGGPVGEPALGPPAYMHRPSAEDNRWAPLSHHLQDATHITMGVGTAGLRLWDFQIEGSLFNGREPDENRTDIEFKPWDSYAVRLSYAPGDNVAFQLSSGYLTGPEALDPGDILRTTASLQLAGRLGTRTVTGMASWGQNQGKAGHPATTLQSYLLEGTAELGWMLKTYLRAEAVDKDTLDLTGIHDHTVHRVSAVTLGLVRELGDFETFGLALGADATFNVLNEPAASAYGLNPMGFRAYVRLGPPAMHMMQGAAGKTSLK